MTESLMLVSELSSMYLDLGPITKPTKRAISWKNDASNLKRHLLPLIGNLPVAQVTRLSASQVISDIRNGATSAIEKTGKRGLARIRGGEAASRRTRGVAAALWRWGYEHGCISNFNPFSTLRLGMAVERERFLSMEEVGRLLQSLRVLQNCNDISQTYADAILVLLFTGARKTEILGLKWDEVFMEKQLLELPQTRTKAGGRNGLRKIYLSAEAVRVLRRRYVMRNPSSEFVFPAARGTGAAVGLRKPFVRLCAHAGLIDFRIHDLRHSFASFAVQEGVELTLIGKALGHADLRSTERYAHAGAAALIDVAEKVARSWSD